MNVLFEPDLRIAAWLSGETPERAPERVLIVTRERIRSTRQRRLVWVPRRAFPTARTRWLGIAVAAAVVVAAVGILILPDRGAITGPASSPTASPSPSASPSPTATPSPTAPPSPDPALSWSLKSLGKDWPAPVRQEPVGGAPFEPAIDYTDDEKGEIGSTEVPWIDISSLSMAGSGFRRNPNSVVSVYVNLAAELPVPLPDPAERWIAYGLVLDTNGDGMPDVRLGIDNIPASVKPGHRTWRTDLHTGQTMTMVGGPYGAVGNAAGTASAYVDTFWPGEWQGKNLARFGVVLLPGEAEFRFYTWASVIEDGRVVATDYAPNSGWLDVKVSP
jgi:hypothetical protein